MIDQLTRMLSGRIDGDWAYISTAAGNPESRAIIESGLSVEALRRDARCQVVEPNVVGAHVQALAAYRPTLLAEAAHKWIRPIAIGDHPWWAAAWRAALRHLKALSVIDEADADVPQLSSEVAIVWSRNPSRAMIWHEFVGLICARRLFYENVRALANCTFDEADLSEADILGAPWQALRLLRGRVEHLRPAARQALKRRARAWRSGGNPNEAALLAEFCKEVSPEILDELRDEVTRTLASIEDPRQLIPLVYVLMSDWQMP